MRLDGSAGAELMVFGEIGWEVDASAVARELKALGSVDLTVRINSYGGSAFDGVAIMNALRGYAGRVTTVVEGIAASAASVIAVGGGDRVVMRPGSELMIHDAWQYADGSADELRKIAETLETLSASIAGVYAAKAGTPVEMWREAMRVESWFSADEAVSAGLADVVEDARAAVVPVANRAQSRVARTFNYAGRGDAPRPSVLADAALSGREGGDMSFVKAVAARLGMTESVDDENVVMAALAEVLGEVDETSGGDTPPAVDEDGDTPPVDEDETPVDEDGDTPPAVDEVVDEDEDGDEDEDDDEDEDGDEDTPPAVEVVTLDPDVYADLLERARRGDAADEAAVERDASELVAAAIRDGKVLAAKRESLVARAVEDFDAMKAYFDTLASGTIPVAEKGRGGSDESRGDKGPRRARARLAGLPTV